VRSRVLGVARLVHRRAPVIAGKVLVNPTNWTLGTPLQQASARSDAQFPLLVMPPSGSTWAP
jgi:hypothetical protein